MDYLAKADSIFLFAHFFDLHPALAIDYGLELG
jgi:hypothetical protein